MTIAPIRPTVTTACPVWCAQDHANNPVDDPKLHMSDTSDSSVPLSYHDGDVLIGVYQRDGSRPMVAYTDHEGNPEYRLTPGEAETFIEHIEDLIDIIEANGKNTCWCNGDHRPGDQHCYLGEAVRLSFDGHLNHELMTHIVREWDGDVTYVEVSHSHYRRTPDRYTVNEARELVALLRSRAADARGKLAANV